jgi:hypothetical protein
VAIVAERGVLAAALLALAFLGMAKGGVRQLRTAADAEQGMIAATLLGTLAGALVTGMFDAVLLLALPTLLVFAALGASFAPALTPETVPAPRRMRLVLLMLIAASLLGTLRSVAQLTAMQLYVNHGDRASLARASRIDPGNYRLRMRLARMGKRQQRCEHALAAHALFPNGEAARAASRGCQD